MFEALGGALPAASAHQVLQSCTTSGNQVICPAGLSGGGAGILGALLIIELIFLVVFIVAYVKILQKAGYSGWWVLIGLVPFVNLVFFLIFAFTKWPVNREVEMLRAQLAGGYGASPGYGGRPPPTYGAGPTPMPTPSGPTAAIGIPMVVQTELEAVHAPLPTFGQVMRGGPTVPAATFGGTPAEAAPSTTGHPPAGWFPDPSGAVGRQRYWDGTQWTDQYQ